MCKTCFQRFVREQKLTKANDKVDSISWVFVKYTNILHSQYVTIPKQKFKKSPLGMPKSCLYR